VTRSGSLKRLALFGAVVLVAFVALYIPTLTGEAPWSWFIGGAPGWVWFVSGLGVGLLVSHFTWPQTDRWPELEREVARLLRMNDPRDPARLLDLRWHHHLSALVRPHVLERERR